MFRRVRSIVAAALWLFLAMPFASWTACAPASAPVAVVTLAIDRLSAPIGAPVEFTIRFNIAPDFQPVQEEYRVSLSAFNADSVLLWRVDHDPPVPTSAWRPGQPVEYTELVTIPQYPHVGPVTIAIGLFSPLSGTWLPLAGASIQDSLYPVATLTLLPPHESSFIGYDDGWHSAEFGRIGQAGWRWTTGRAVLIFRNPFRTINLRLDIEGRPDLLDEPQEVALVISDRTLRNVTLHTNQLVRLDYELAAEELGDDDIVRLEILVTPTFVPADHDPISTDTRRLGVRVRGAYVEPLPDSRP
jgi:hypothetical protein